MLALLRPGDDGRSVAIHAAAPRNQTKHRWSLITAVAVVASATTTLVGFLAPAAGARAAAPAPKPATSYYMQTINPRRLFAMGCRLGTGVRHHSQPRDALVLLDFGMPRRHRGLYGTHLYFGKFARSGYIQ